jgi:L-alanine-DL-glutamate epimerase-like enolase superfamily enzyme
MATVDTFHLVFGTRDTPEAILAIDIALWDIRGEAIGWPLNKLLGINNPTSIKTFQHFC